MPKTQRFSQSLLASVIAAGSLCTMTGTLQAQTSEPATGIEQVVVTGIRQSLERSIDVKRDANSVVDVITAEDIGKLPDSTIVDSLQRVTGVQIERTAGEGSRVSIRGSANVMTMLNGEQFLSAGNITGVQPDLTDIPSTMVSAVEVQKSPTATTLTGGLTGTINLKTHRPLNLDAGQTTSTELTLARGSRTQEDDYGLQAFTGFNGGQWGYTLNASYSDFTLGDDLAGSNGGDYAGWWGMPNESWALPQPGEDLNNNGEMDNFIQYQGFQAAHRVTQRKRLGVNGSLQFQLSDAVSLLGEAFYTDMEQSRRRRGLSVTGAWTNDWTNPVLGPRREAPEGAEYADFHSVQQWQINALRVVPNSNEQLDQRESLNTNLELNYDNGGAFTASLRYVHGNASNDSISFEMDSYITDGTQHNGYSTYPDGTEEPVNVGGYHGTPALASDGTPALNENGESRGNAVVGNVAFAGDKLVFDLPSDLGADISQYGLVSNHLSGQKGEASLDVVRFDGSYELNFADLTSVDFGLRIGTREVTYDDWINIALFENADGEPYGIRWKDADGTAPNTGETSYFNIKFSDPRISNYVVSESDYPGVEGVGDILYIDTSRIDGRDFTNQLFPNNFDYANPGNSYEVEEYTETLYGQLNFEGEWGRFPYRGNIGFRYIRTELETTSNVTEGKIDGETTYTYNGTDYLMGSGWDNKDVGTYVTPNDYDDFLPSLNLAVTVAPDHLVRFAYNKAMTMHNLDNLGQGLTVQRLYTEEYGDGVFTVDSASQNGNPNLEPQRTTNADLSYEWYFGRGGLFSAAAFYRDNETSLVRDFIIRDDLADSDGVIRNDSVRTSILTSVPGGETKGFEVGYQQALLFLPGFWKDFGVTANYTYSPSESEQTGFYGEKLPEGRNSKHQTNFIVWYENERFSARLAHNWRSEQLEWVADIWGTPLAVWQEPTDDLSVSMSYDINDTFSVNFEGVNLLEEQRTRYLGWEDQKDKFFFTERRLNLSLRATF